MSARTQKITVEIAIEDYLLLKKLFRYYGGMAYAIRKYIRFGLKKDIANSPAMQRDLEDK